MNYKFSVGYLIYSVEVTWNAAVVLEKNQTCNGLKGRSLKKHKRVHFYIANDHQFPLKVEFLIFFLDDRQLTSKLLCLDKDNDLCVCCMQNLT